ncbi:MAG: serine hydrolase domain-containing protein, partial [Candidatus Binataceae bacterium]
GKVSLDDPIRKYVPQVPDFGTPITLRELLHHTSGLRDQWELLIFDGWRMANYEGAHIGTDLITDGDILYLVSRQKDLDFPPGTDWLYSNTGYTLLAQVVRQVSGQSLREFTSANVFEPLGMNQTHFRDNHAEVVKNLASAYEEINHAYVLSVPNDDTSGPTALITTVGDLARWDENFYNPRVGGEEVIKGLQEPGKRSDGTQLDYAVGAYTYDYRGLKVLDSSGMDAGYMADLIRFPEQHFSAATLCNLRSTDPIEMNRRIADIYLAKQLKPPTPPPPPFSASLEDLRSKTGIYVSESPDNFLRVSLKDGSLWGLAYVGSPFKLEPVSQNRFSVFGGAAYLDFEQNDSRVVWTNKNDYRPYENRRVNDYAPTGAELGEFAGTYRSPELDVPYLVTLEKDGLVVYPPKIGAVALSPVTGDLFQGGRLGWCVRFTRNAQGHVSGFRIRTVRVRNLRFERVAQ